MSHNIIPTGYRAYRDWCCHLANVYELMYATQPTLANSSNLASAEVHALSTECSIVITK